jgi:hypothetical protein
MKTLPTRSLTLRLTAVYLLVVVATPLVFVGLTAQFTYNQATGQIDE